MQRYSVRTRYDVLSPATPGHYSRSYHSSPNNHCGPHTSANNHSGTNSGCNDHCGSHSGARYYRR